MNDQLVVWVVYDNGDGIYSVRPQYPQTDLSVIPSRVACVGTNLDELRRPLEELGLYRMDRYPEDDPAIVETWI